MPKIKHALFCRILTYAVFGGIPIAFLIVLPLVFDAFPSLPDVLGIAIFILVALGETAFLFQNFVVLVTMDAFLASTHCFQTARKYFPLPRGFSEKSLNGKLSRFGKKCDPLAVSPRPDMLRYKSSAPVTIYSCGIERIVMTYRAELLTKELYHSIMNSAVANSKALAGKKKHIFLDKEQKKSPLNRATVVIIYAKDVDGRLKDDTWNIVCKNGGNENISSTVPCIIELRDGRCTFDSVRVPYIGFGYPAKNRGIRLIRKYVFGGKLPLEGESDRLDAKVKDLDTEQSLWAFYGQLKRDFREVMGADKKRFKKMSHGEIVEDDGFVYLKLGENGISLPVELDEETKTADIEESDLWDFPKHNKVSKARQAQIKDIIGKYYRDRGYTVKFHKLGE